MIQSRLNRLETRADTMDRVCDDIRADLRWIKLILALISIGLTLLLFRLYKTRLRSNRSQSL